MLRMGQALPGLGVALLTAIAVMAVAAFGYGVAWSPADIGIVTTGLLVLVAVHAYAVSSDPALRRAGIAIAVGVFLVGAANAVVAWWPIQKYGDSAFVVSLVESRVPFSRWLSGSALLAWAYAGLWTFPPLAGHLPASVASAQGFVSLAASVCMAGTAVAALLAGRAPLAVYVTTTSTIWLVFGLGYVEYYPFIAGPLLLVLAWLYGSAWDRIDPRVLGGVLGVLASAYVGFWPLVAVLGLTFVLSAPRRNWPAVGWGLLAFLCCVRVFWPGSPPEYFAALWGDMNFGEAHIPPEYAGLSAGPTSVYFLTSHVLTPGHLRGLAYQAFFSGTIGPLLLLCGFAAVAVSRGGRGLGRVSPPVLAAVLLLVYYVRYFAWKIPKLGLRMDIDLYFVFYLFVAFFLGLALERGAAGRPLVPARRHLVLSFLAGGVVPLCYLFALKGLPNP